VASTNGSRYGITIIDWNKASSFLSTENSNLSGPAWNENSQIGKSFKKAIDYFDIKFKNYDSITQKNLSYELAMATVLSEYNTGVALMKKNIDGKFLPLVVTISTNPRKPKKIIYTILNCL